MGRALFPFMINMSPNSDPKRKNCATRYDKDVLEKDGQHTIFPTNLEWKYNHDCICPCQMVAYCTSNCMHSKPCGTSSVLGLFEHQKRSICRVPVHPTHLQACYCCPNDTSIRQQYVRASKAKNNNHLMDRMHM